jgi:hypothetical protein
LAETAVLKAVTITLFGRDSVLEAMLEAVPKAMHRGCVKGHAQGRTRPSFLVGTVVDENYASFDSKNSPSMLTNFSSIRLRGKFKKALGDQELELGAQG